MKEQFTNRYSLSKTLRFSLIPVGATEENFERKQLLLQDEHRAESYKKVKGYMDRYHKVFIERILSGLVLDGVAEYAPLYAKRDKTDAEKKQMDALETKMRKQIADAFKNDPERKRLSDKSFIREILPAFLTLEEEKADVAEFYEFSTYFRGFFENRENMYSAEAQTTAISHRCVNDNLPRFLDNANSFRSVLTKLPEADLAAVNAEAQQLFGFDAEYAFRPDHFTFFLSQSQIDRYNQLLGGYAKQTGEKVQGLNEYINLYNQKIDKKETRLPKLKPLYKQILSDRETVSFVAEAFADDEALLAAVRNFVGSVDGSVKTDLLSLVGDIDELIARIDTFALSGIFIPNGVDVTTVSAGAFGAWDAITSAWNAEYEQARPRKKTQDEEKYFDARKKAFKAIESFSLAELQRLGAAATEEDRALCEWLKSTANACRVQIETAHKACAGLLAVGAVRAKKLAADQDAVNLLKDLLDSVKALETLLRPLQGTGKEPDKDEAFYGEFLPKMDALSVVDRLYDQVRNYVTKKPYSKDKIKLNFENPQFLGGWDKNKESDYRSVILRKDGKYYLAITDRSASRLFDHAPTGSAEESCYEKMEYKLLPGPNKMLPKVFFAAKNIECFAPSAEILSIKEKESFKKGPAFDIDDCHKYIDFMKASIAKHRDWSNFGFRFSDTKDYNDISEFYREISQQGYSVRFAKIPESFIMECIDAGKLYLFQIYSKDFSAHSHGKPNLHTLYFKMLFDERNLSDVVYKLSGDAEMFFRHPSISEAERIVHPANEPLENKNKKNRKATSTFGYDLIKDKRFTERKFFLHLPISINYKAPDFALLNREVRRALHDAGNQHVIGIDRGERNLLYVCVIDGAGRIVEQYSLNEIVSDNGHTVDYHALLEDRETKRDKARKSWATVESIKELKEGYMSQVVRKICELAIKYDAIIAMEDLNSGFKNSRVKVEKQVYQKFETMLTEKLRFLVLDKDLAQADRPGGLLRAYQLANPDNKNRGVQDGIIFYVPAWLTSKIDPTTGFASLLKPKYESTEKASAFFALFDDIRYNAADDLFEFSFDYANFPKCSVDARRVWTVCTYGKRIATFRDPENNNAWTDHEIALTPEMKKLFAEYGVDISADLRAQIVAANDKTFYMRLMRLLSLTLQMRNSKTGDVNVDYLISPVRGGDGAFFRSGEDPAFPMDADANGAYNIARKALWAVGVLRETPVDRLDQAKLSITNKDWLAFAQNV